MFDSVRVSIVVFLVLLSLATTIDIRFCCGNPDVLCIESERQALLKFKQDLKDPSNRLSSWTLAKADCCLWAGIICDNITGHVKELHLNNPLGPDWESQVQRDAYESSKLRGIINPTLLNLRRLSYLDLSYNDFGGIPIPSFIGSLVSLTYLNLSEAGFEGLIPQQLGNLTSLRYLSLRGSAVLDRGVQTNLLYVENLHWLYHLPSLLNLDLNGVNLSAASDWLLVINTLPSLLELDLSLCGLFHIPALSAVNFTSLSTLKLLGNNFGTLIPRWILTLSNLIYLDLGSSYFEGPIPDGISNLTSLRILDLSYNNLLFPLPNWLFSLHGLVSLSLKRNQFQGPIPSGFKNITSLRNLDLSENDFPNSTIPEWLYNLQYLESLDLHATDLQGEISSAIQNMTSLIMLEMSYNKLEGTLPRAMGNLCSLQVIRLDDNKLGGEISKVFESISGCLSQSIEAFVLNGNYFSGHLPDKLGELGNLRDFELRGNLISGPIPESLGRLSSLGLLNLNGNRLTGTLPESLGNLSNLEELRISNNMLEGVVSEVHFENLNSLKALTAYQNRFSLKVSPAWVPPFRLNELNLGNLNVGPQFPMWLQSQDLFWGIDLSGTGISDKIPTWFWNLTSRTLYLNLSHNQIHGELPNNLGIESSLALIYLGSNQFSGPLPRISSNITELDLSNNSFSGTISHFLCDTTAQQNRLKILDLGENHLSGEIPDCWMKWQSLEVIKLGDNTLTGGVPSSLGYLSCLQSLHLRNNSLSGEIPVSLRNLPELFTLELGLNNFVGKIPAWLGSSLPQLIVRTN